MQGVLDLAGTALFPMSGVRVFVIQVSLTTYYLQVTNIIILSATTQRSTILRTSHSASSSLRVHAFDSSNTIFSEASEGWFSCT